MEPINILIAPDKFKGSISAVEICEILANELYNVNPTCKIKTDPMADGGDGSVEVLSGYLNVVKKECATVDPLGRPMRATYYCTDDTAFIELASASGLVLIEPNLRNPLHTSTYGTGLLILDALKKGIENIYLFLGGSSTNDGGVGIAAALGYKFLDKNGSELKPKGIALSSIAKIVPPPSTPKMKSFNLCCDVDNPPFGTQGAAQVYAAQKGATKDEIRMLDEGVRNLCKQILLYNGLDLTNLKGGGAAGGTALCPVALFNGSIISGLDYIAQMVDLERKIEKADLVISGEGKLDSQSSRGKVVSGIAGYCKKMDKKLWLVVGKNELSATALTKMGIDRVFAVFDKAKDMNDAMVNTRIHLQSIGREIAALLSHKE